MKISKIKFIPAIIGGLIITGIASAALVSYLSNTAIVTTDVESPVIVSVVPENIEAVGNDTIAIDITTENLSNNPINGISVTAIEGNSLTGEEITKIMLNDTNDITDDTCVVDIDGTLTTLSSLTDVYSKITLLFHGDTNSDCTGSASINDINAKTPETDHIDITLNQATSPDTYTISSQYINDLDESVYSVLMPS